MRKLIFLVSAAIAVATSACVSSSSNYTDPYAAVRPGINIYNAAWTQTRVSLDPTGVAIRLEMLLAEAEKQNTSYNTVQGTFKNTNYQLKDLFFGSSAVITEVEENVYNISFSGSNIGPLDTFYREGTYLVDTRGVRLSEATDSNPWTVAQVADMKLWTIDSYTSQRIVYVLYDLGGTHLFFRNNQYVLSFENLKASLENYSNYTSDWAGNFNFAPTENVADLSFSTQKEATFRFYGNALGTTFYTFNDVSAVHLSYTTPVTAPLEWRPWQTSPWNLIISGIQSAALLSPSDYNVSDYPSPSVSVRYELQNNTVSTTLTYNGQSTVL